MLVNSAELRDTYLELMKREKPEQVVAWSRTAITTGRKIGPTTVTEQRLRNFVDLESRLLPSKIWSNS